MSLFSIAQTLLALLLIASILMQGRGGGLGSSWGGDGQLYGTRRGIEKILFRATILFGILFIFLSLASLIL